MDVIKCKVLNNCVYNEELFLTGDIVYISDYINNPFFKTVYSSERKLLVRKGEIDMKDFDITNPIE